MKCALMHDNSVYIIEHEDAEVLDSLANEWERLIGNVYRLNFTTYVAVYRDKLGIPLKATMSEERASVLARFGNTPAANRAFTDLMRESVDAFNASKVSYPDPLDWFAHKGCNIWKVDRVIKVVAK